MKLDYPDLVMVGLSQEVLRIEKEVGRGVKLTDRVHNMCTLEKDPRMTTAIVQFLLGLGSAPHAICSG